VREIQPAAQVVYVDTDPVVLSHARALLATGDGVTAAEADLGDPDAVFAAPELRAVIDPARPVCVVLGAVLHFLPADEAQVVVSGYAELLVPGSYLVVSVACFDDQALAGELAGEYTAAPFYNHSIADVMSFFAGLDMAGPDVAEAATWRPWQDEPAFRRRDGHVLVGVARIGGGDGW
jgi:O-methyltransferase involved in polyketide biosynthesis